MIQNDISGAFFKTLPVISLVQHLPCLSLMCSSVLLYIHALECVSCTVKLHLILRRFFSYGGKLTFIYWGLITDLLINEQLLRILTATCYFNDAVQSFLHSQSMTEI